MRTVKASAKSNQPCLVSRAVLIRQYKKKQMSRESSADENLAEKLSQVHVAVPCWKPLRLRLLILKHSSRKLLMMALCFVGAAAALFEIRTSEFEARVLSALNSKLSYKLGPGPSADIAFPA